MDESLLRACRRCKGVAGAGDSSPSCSRLTCFVNSGRRMLMRRQGAIAAMLFVIYAVPAHAQTAALSGRVSSQEEGNMEGVVVRAKRTGSTITVSVVTDAQGRYRFPADRLDAGQYGLSI